MVLQHERYYVYSLTTGCPGLCCQTQGTRVTTFALLLLDSTTSNVP